MILKNKKANLLTENIIFLVLNLVFLMILVLFLFSKMGNAAVLEETYSKQIALIIDSAKEGMQIQLDMTKAINEKDDTWNAKSMVSISDNIVTVKLREKGGASYSFFNKVNADNYYFDEKANKLVLNIENE